MSSIVLPQNSPAFWSVSSGIANQGLPDSPPESSQSPMPVGCVFDSLQIWASANQGGGGGNDNLTFTLFQNGVATALTCSLTIDPQNPQTCADTTDTVTVAAGDLLEMQVVDNNAGDLTNMPIAGVGSGLHCH